MSETHATHEAPEEPEEPKLKERKAVRKGRQSLSNVRRALTEQELSSPAVQRMLIDEIERLEGENIEVSVMRDRYHAADKRASILEERSKRSISGQIIFGVCLAVGAAAMGHAPAAWPNQPSGWLFLTFGAILVAAGIASRVVQR